MQIRDRRAFMRLLAVGGVTFASALRGLGRAHASPRPRAYGDDFFFLQLTDTHWGYQGAANPEAEHTLRDTVRIINASPIRPRFVVFTGDLVQTTSDDALRAARMRQFREIVADLRVPELHFIPGEHDAGLDRGATYRAHFGAPTYSFDRGGIHFIALDNGSAPSGALGDAQLAWLRDDLAMLARGTPVVVFAHRPLFALEPSWSWSTPDGERALALLGERENVTVFYGHIHQEHHERTGRVLHHAARSLVFPLPAKGSAPTRNPLPWQAGAADHGLGYRAIHAAHAALALEEIAVLQGV